MENSHLPESVYENLPEFLKNLTNSFTGRERDIILLSSIGVISACLPNVFGVYDTNRYSSNLFLLIVAPPASGKGVMSKSRKLVEKIHDSIKNISSAEIKSCEEEKKKNKGNFAPCPDLDIKLLPGNVSSSKIYNHLQNSSNGLLIFESEADTISQMFKQDWGNFSDVLRKAFHHEAISISRDVDGKFHDIYNPELSMVISGTPNQVKPLVQSKENGLFSRFMFYYFNEPSLWKDVSPNSNTIDTSNLFNEAGNSLLNLHDKLTTHTGKIEIRLSDQQWENFNLTMTTITNSVIQENLNEIVPIIKRQGVILFRISMILTMIRNIDSSFENEIIYCNDTDYYSAREIIKSTIDHSLKISTLLTDKPNPKEFLNARELILLSNLNTDFTRAEALIIASLFNIPERSLGYILNKMVSHKIIKRNSNGNYTKQ